MRHITKATLDTRYKRVRVYVEVEGMVSGGGSELKLRKMIGQPITSTILGLEVYETNPDVPKKPQPDMAEYKDDIDALDYTQVMVRHLDGEEEYRRFTVLSWPADEEAMQKLGDFGGDGGGPA